MQILPHILKITGGHQAMTAKAMTAKQYHTKPSYGLDH
jgi:hypothetical protein